MDLESGVDLLMAMGRRRGFLKIGVRGWRGVAGVVAGADADADVGDSDASMLRDDLRVIPAALTANIGPAIPCRCVVVLLLRSVVVVMVWVVFASGILCSWFGILES